MPARSKMKIKEIERLQKTARRLYKEGYSYRAIAPMVGRSFRWVGYAIQAGRKNLSTVQSK